MSAERILPNWCEAEVDDMAGAHEQATMVVRSLIAMPGREDWRAWVVHVSDDLDEEIFTLPFSSIMSRLH